MFGFGKGNSQLVKINARNSFCARIFHDLATPIFKARSGETSEKMLIDAQFVDLLNQDLEKTKAALIQLDRGDVVARIIIQHIEINKRAATQMFASFGDNIELMEFGGVSCAAGTCQRLIFGVAPAFSDNQLEVKAHTLTLLEMLEKTALSLLEPSNSFRKGYVGFVSHLKDAIFHS